MKTMTVRTNTVLTRVIAGALTAVISPLAAFLIGTNFDISIFGHVTGAVNAAADYIVSRSSQPNAHLENTLPIINNGELMLYNYTALEIDPEPQKEPKTQLTPEEIAEKADKELSEEMTEQLPEEIFEELQETFVPVISRNISLERENFSIFSARDGSVVKRTFRPRLSENYIQLLGGGQVKNDTKITDDRLRRESYLPPKFKPEKGTEPQVLIIHTHTTESFLLSNDGYYDSDYTFRTLDPSKSIVAVGAKVAEEIAKAGFATIHDGTVHDYPVYSGAYKRSAETIQEILREYPSIKVVLDIHRDAIEADNKPVAAVTEDSAAAQIMIISPADNGDWGVPDFMKNFRFASRLQSRLETDNPGLTRALLFQYCNYNMHLSQGALLIEIGSHGNTLEQALRAGELLGRSMGALLEELANTIG